MEMIVCHDLSNFTPKQLAYACLLLGGLGHKQLRGPLPSMENVASQQMEHVVTLMKRNGEYTCEMRDSTGFIIEGHGDTWWLAVLRARVWSSYIRSVGVQIPASVCLA